MPQDRASDQESLFLLEEILCTKPVLAGIGSPLRGDDRFGLLVCEELNKRGIHCITCEYGLENCIHEIIAEKKRTLILFDAILCDDCSPGDLFLADIESAVDKELFATTHSFPLKLIIKLLKEAGIEQIVVVGVIPRSLEISEEVSEEAKRALMKLVEFLDSVMKKCSKVGS